jgi:hypothetical protein
LLEDKLKVSKLKLTKEKGRAAVLARGQVEGE